MARWRFLELNCNQPRARFLAVQDEGSRPSFERDWRRYESLAQADGLFDAPINSIGNRYGKWHAEPKP